MTRTRIRTIKPEFFDDETICDLPDDVALFFVNLWQHASDFGGRFVWSAYSLGGRRFARQGEQHVADLLVQLYRAQLVECYTDGRDLYGCVANFDRHQTVSRPTECDLPRPDDDGVTHVQPPERPIERRKRRAERAGVPSYREAMRWTDDDCKLVEPPPIARLPAGPPTAPIRPSMGTVEGARVECETSPDGPIANPGLRDPFTESGPDSTRTPRGRDATSMRTHGGRMEASRGKGREKVTTSALQLKATATATAKNYTPHGEPFPSSARGREGEPLTAPIASHDQPASVATSSDDDTDDARDASGEPEQSPEVEALIAHARQIARDDERGLALARLVWSERVWRGAFEPRHVDRLLASLWLAWGPGHPNPSSPKHAHDLASKLHTLLRNDTPADRLVRLGALARLRQQRIQSDPYLRRDRVAWLVEDDWSDLPDPRGNRARARDELRAHFLATPDERVPDRLRGKLPRDEVRAIRAEAIEEREHNLDANDGLPFTCGMTTEQLSAWYRDAMATAHELPPDPVLDGLYREELAFQAEQRAAAAPKPTAPPVEPLTPAQLADARVEIRACLDAGRPTEHLRSVLGPEYTTVCLDVMREGRAPQRGAPLPPSTADHGQSSQQAPNGAQAGARGARRGGDPVVVDSLLNGIGWATTGGDAE